MLPDPLHPAVVHFPLALSALLPAVILVALAAIRLGAPPRRTWAVVVAAGLLLSASAFFATETGEDQQGVAETIVAHRYIEEHEEAGELLFRVSLALLAVALIGLSPSRIGGAARLASLAGSALLLALALQAGHTGGELVYKHGAARAYVVNAQKRLAGPASEAATDGHAEDDDSEAPAPAAAQ